MNPLSPAKFRWRQLALGTPAGMVHGVLIAWLATNLQAHFAPWLLFPVLMGLLLGATFTALVRLSQVGHRRTILLLTLVTVATAVVGQHYLSYQQSRQVASEEAKLYQKAQQVAPMFLKGRPVAPASSFAEFLRGEATRGRQIGHYRAHDSVAWLSWGLDGLLMMLGALALVMPALRQPYCDHCRSWFHTTRIGQVDPATAQQLASLLEVLVPEGTRAARYRLVGCNGGCGPTGFELHWETKSNRSHPTRTWLDVERRNNVVALLDKVAL